MPVWYFGYAHFSILGNTGPAAVLPRGTDQIPVLPQLEAGQGCTTSSSWPLWHCCLAITQPHTPKGQKVLAHMLYFSVTWALGKQSWETVLKQGAPELNIFTGSACVWQRASSEKHREEKEEKLLRSQNILNLSFQNGRAELFALNWPVSDKRTLKYNNNIQKNPKTGEKMLLRAQHAEYCGDARIIILAQTHCFGQTKITDRNTVIVLCDSLTSVSFSHKSKKAIICLVLMKIKWEGKKNKRKYTACEHTTSGSFACKRPLRNDQMASEDSRFSPCAYHATDFHISLSSPIPHPKQSNLATTTQASKVPVRVQTPKLRCAMRGAWSHPRAPRYCQGITQDLPSRQKWFII